MSEERLLCIDIRDSKISTVAEGGEINPLWTRSDNSFRFNFFTGGAPPPPDKTSVADHSQPPSASLSFTGQGSTFAFNFQIPPAEDMDTKETTNPSSLSNPQCIQEEEPSHLQGVGSASGEQCKTKKKKKKSGKKKPSDAETQQKPTEGSQREEELSPEEELNRQLDWCIEQLELGIRSQNGTPKQKEEASRALKTLRSSKAPLVKKRQLMRAMTGDYRKKMEEEKNKQFNLIQSETASAQVKVVSDAPKKSVFHRRAEGKSAPGASEDQQQQTDPQGAEKPKLQTQEEKAAFVFVPSKEEFQFNFF